MYKIVIIKIHLHQCVTVVTAIRCRSIYTRTHISTPTGNKYALELVGCNLHFHVHILQNLHHTVLFLGTAEINALWQQPSLTC